MKQTLKPIATEISDFEDLRKQDFLYVDKTEIFYNLLVKHREIKYCFFARPRRFGKSLTVSTLEYIFSGRKELFKDLYIYDKYSFEEYPVLRLDMNLYNSSSLSAAKADLLAELVRIAEQYGIKDDVEAGAKEPSSYFARLIRGICEKEKKRVVVLIDEYDHMLLENMQSDEFDAIRTFLASFYEILKVREKEVRFVFLTGVTRFSHVSLFSRLNNLRDISEDEEFISLCGYKDFEIDHYFSAYLTSYYVENGIENENEKREFRDKIKNYYDGYRFSLKSEIQLYNPVSVGRFFSSGCVFENYWLMTGSQQNINILIKKHANIFKKSNEFLIQPEDAVIFEVKDLFSDNVDSSSLYSYFLQSGYLTIKGFNDNGYLVLSYPNQEVATVMSVKVLNALKYKITAFVFDNIAEALIEEDTERMIEELKKSFVNFPYDASVIKENSFQFLMFYVIQAIAKDARLEEHVRDGRSDISALVKDNVAYVIELKLDKTADSALKQIKDKSYAERYQKKGMRVHLLGINFSSKTRTIDSWKEEIISL